MKIVDYVVVNSPSTEKTDYFFQVVAPRGVLMYYQCTNSAKKFTAEEIEKIGHINKRIVKLNKSLYLLKHYVLSTSSDSDQVLLHLGRNTYTVCTIPKLVMDEPPSLL